MAEAVVVGGGFFGLNVAHYLATQRGFRRVTVIEREDRVMTRSSFVNQARVHGGYHYPRSFSTAYRSRVSLARFRSDFPEAVFDRFTCLYAIARRQSKVTTRQMERFCQAIGAPLGKASDELTRLFNPALVERVWTTEEHAFDADRLREALLLRLREADVALSTGTSVSLIACEGEQLLVRHQRGDESAAIAADFVFNCTYANLQQVGGPSAPDFRLRHEIAEVVLVDPPPALSGLGITLMDGPFFSLFPFPARGHHSLTHVRYTPHTTWADDPQVAPFDRLAAHPPGSACDWMIRDAARYVPLIAECQPRQSLIEVKTVLQRSDANDSRPILFERHGPQGRLISILGGKLDNIYDVFERLDAEDLAVMDHAR